MIPLHFNTDQNNEMYAWMSVVLLPFMEGKRFHKIWNFLKNKLKKEKGYDLDNCQINKFGSSNE